MLGGLDELLIALKLLRNPPKITSMDQLDSSIIKVEKLFQVADDVFKIPTFLW